MCARISIALGHQVMQKWEGHRSRKQEANVWTEEHFLVLCSPKGDFQAGVQQAENMCFCQMYTPYCLTAKHSLFL